MRLGVMFGGPSKERGVSINSARAIVEMLEIQTDLYYVGTNLKVFKVDHRHMYSNTPEDFDHCLQDPIENFWDKVPCDFVIPVIHGRFGEDGALQEILEKQNCPFLFSGSKACKEMFYKDLALSRLTKEGLYNKPYFIIKSNSEEKDWHKKLEEYLEKFGEIVIKAVDGGSSLEVFFVRSLEEAIAVVGKTSSYVVEPRYYEKEFSLSVLNGKSQIPVEVRFSENSSRGSFFNYRNKYFPTNEVKLLCPPSFSEKVIRKIRKDAERIYGIFEARDGVRMDGRVSDEGEVFFTDLNPIPSLEFNSVFFQSFTERNYVVLNKMLDGALSSNGITRKKDPSNLNKKTIPVLMGGTSTERQVSLLSGASVCMKMVKSKSYVPSAYVLDGDYVYNVQFTSIFKHCLEDVFYDIEHAKEKNEILEKLGFEKKRALERIPLDDFIKNQDFVFLALHGGEGEDGTLQKKLERSGVAFNGEGERLSALCMDKDRTLKEIEKLGISCLQFLDRRVLSFPYSCEGLEEFFREAVIVKPVRDGSSMGVSKLTNIGQLKTYVKAIEQGKSFVSIEGKIIDLPVTKKCDLLIEKYRNTCRFAFEGKEIRKINSSDWIELTVGFFEKCFIPSLTVVSNGFLSAEEKFQTGTGVNLTPPPEWIVSRAQVEHIKSVVTQIFEGLGFRSYGRIDLFFNTKTNNITILEINTLPALTFSTVLFQQALRVGIAPTELIEKLIDNGIKKAASSNQKKTKKEILGLDY